MMPRTREVLARLRFDISGVNRGVAGMIAGKSRATASFVAIVVMTAMSDMIIIIVVVTMLTIGRTNSSSKDPRKEPYKAWTLVGPQGTETWPLLPLPA